jgi:hypothetical protein
MTPITMWRTSWRGVIQKVECFNVTPKTVWLLTDIWRPDRHLREPEREARKTKHHSYHETWEEAHAYLMAQANENLEKAQLQLQKAQGHYGNIKGMKKPEEQ